MTNSPTPPIIVKPFEKLSTEELYEILKARFVVFFMEQRCFDLDMDGIDYQSLHFLIRDDGGVIAYARLFPEKEEGVWHVGRMLTTRRKQGLGTMLMQEIIRTAWAKGATLLCMHAQSHAIGFYHRLGFRVCSEEFMEAGIPHVKMELTKG